MFFCKEIFGDVPKALSGKGLDGLSDTSNFLDRLTFSVILHFSICTLPFTLFGSGSSGLGIHETEIQSRDIGDHTEFMGFIRGILWGGHRPSPLHNEAGPWRRCFNIQAQPPRGADSTHQILAGNALPHKLRKRYVIVKIANCKRLLLLRHTHRNRNEGGEGKSLK